MGDAVLSTELQAAARGALALAAWGHGGQRPPSRGPGPRRPSGQPGNGRREEREEPPPGTRPCRPLRGAAGRKQPLVDAGTPRPTRPRCPGLRRGPWPRTSRSQRRPKPPTSSACLSLQSKCFSLLRGTVMLQGTGTRSAGATAARPTRQPRPSRQALGGQRGRTRAPPHRWPPGGSSAGERRAPSAGGGLGAGLAHGVAPRPRDGGPRASTSSCPRPSPGLPPSEVTAPPSPHTSRGGRGHAHPLPRGFMWPSMNSTLAFLSLLRTLLTCARHGAQSISRPGGAAGAAGPACAARTGCGLRPPVRGHGS